MVLISALEYLASRMRFILFVSDLKGALCSDSGCGIYIAPKDGGIVPVNVHVSAMAVKTKGSD